MFSLMALICAFGTGVAAAEEAPEKEKELEFDLEGYYRTRGYMFKDMFQSPVDGPGALGRPGGTGTYNGSDGTSACMPSRCAGALSGGCSKIQVRW